MNHDEAARLLGAYQDGELDLSTCLKLEEHLAGCEECQQKLAGERELVSIVRETTPRHKPSPFLETRIRAALREQQGEQRGATAPSAAMPWWKYLTAPWLSAGAVACAAVCFAVISVVSPMGPPEFARDALSGHVRSLQVTHLFDVQSTDQHTVKPWFAGKLDFSPQVIDLGPSGYPLVGGRLDILDGQNVAALVYQRRKHYINLFVWPTGSDKANGHFDKDGYHVICWMKSGMNYVAVSELGKAELNDFVKMIQEQTLDNRAGE